jgi:5-methylcytosine-specific restriction endonuclease McrA
MGATLQGKRPKKDYREMLFGSLTVIDQEYRQGHAWLTAQCACGNLWTGKANSLVTGVTTSCGLFCGLKPKGILRQEVSPTGTLHCRHCEQDKPATEFRRNRGARCLACWNAYQRDWTAHNMEKKRASSRSWSARAWAQDHEGMLQKRRDWREDNGDKERATARARYAANPQPEKWMEKNTRRRAMRFGVLVERFTKREIYERDQWKCQLCGGKVDSVARFPHPKSASLDHVIPLSLGGSHTRQNCVLAHLLCNSSKQNRVVVQQQRLF